MVKSLLNQIAGNIGESARGDWKNLSDAELLDHFRKNRNDEAFAVLVRRHRKTVFAACRQVLSDPADIDDAFQATFLLLFKKIAEIDGPTLGCWLYAVAHRVAVRASSNARRRAERERTAASRQQLEVSCGDPSWSEAVAILHEELDRMPDSYRRVLLLCYLRGKSREEAAASLGWTQGAVKGRLERGRKRLAVRLTRRGITFSVVLLAVAGGTAVACPQKRLLELAIQATLGTPSPMVAALAKGVFPVRGAFTKVVTSAVAVAVAGLSVWTGLVLADSPNRSSEPGTRWPKREVTAFPSQVRAPVPKQVPEKVISGIVKDSKDVPVAGATVLAMSCDGSGERLITASGKDGTFSFEKLPPGQNPKFATMILATKEGFAPAEGHTSSENKKEIVLKLREPGNYAGTVKDRNGKPIEGAEVIFGLINKFENGSYWMIAPIHHLRGTPAEKFFIARTDKTGAFRFNTVPAGAVLFFRTRAEGFANLDTTAHGANEEFVVGPNAKPANLALEKESVIRGRVTSSVANVKVKDQFVLAAGPGNSFDIVRCPKTDNEGRFELRGLPANTYTVYVSFSAVAQATAAGIQVTVQAGETTEANLEIIEGVEVTGYVRLRNNDLPVAGATISSTGSFDPKGSGLDPATDKDGRFRLRLPPGEATLAVWMLPHGFRCPGNTREERKIVIPADKKTLEIKEPFVVEREEKKS